jgi:hypothetical protein
VSPPARANVLRRAFEFTQRERRFVLDQLAQVSGLMPLLMKRRNRSNWTPEDLAEIRVHFMRLRSLSPYLAMLLLPGGFFALPLMAWWLDRRRERRDSAGPGWPGRP